jgi:hypothetical protein
MKREIINRKCQSQPCKLRISHAGCPIVFETSEHTLRVGTYGTLKPIINYKAN